MLRWGRGRSSWFIPRHWANSTALGHSRACQEGAAPLQEPRQLLHWERAAVAQGAGIGTAKAGRSVKKNKSGLLKGEATRHKNPSFRNFVLL